MDMIWHNAPCEQTVALSVEVEQSVLNKECDPGTFEPAFPMTGILVLGDSSSQFDGGRSRNVAVFRPSKFLAPLANQFDRNGIMKSKRHRLDGIRFVEVRHKSS
jgi:hypothetical protein